MVMDGAFNHQEERELTQRQSRTQILQLKPCLPLLRPRGSNPPTSPNPFPLIGLWVSKSVRALYLNYRARVSCGFCCKRLDFEGMVVNNSVFEKEKVTTMEDLVEKDGSFEQESEKLCEIRSEIDTSGSLVEESSSSSDFLGSETTGHEEEQSHISSADSASPASVSWVAQKATEAHDCASPNSTNHAEEDERKLEKQDSTVPEIELMKERFAKLLLGEDMSGSGNGVCTALAVSNAITNLCATIFGQIWRLEPLPQEKKAMWRREMEWLLSVSDHIVEFIPSWQTFPDGSKLEVMTCRPRSDLYVNLPALKKLDNMLLELLDSFVDTEFWYVDQGIVAQEADGSHSFRRALQRQEEKWWLPVPRVPPAGLSEDSRKQLQHKRDCTNQILKAAMAINSITLADMEIPDSYLESLPKNGRATLGDLIYRYISSDQFSPEYLLDCLDLASEHHAIEIANRVEASIHVFNRKMSSRPVHNTSRSSSRSSWEMVKELVTDAEKRELLADRAQSLLLCLKQRFPGLPQTTLDMSKIQCNKDVGKSILESYSRVLESLAFNIVARIDDLLHVDNLIKHMDQLPSMSIISQKSTVTIPYQVPASSTPYRTAFSTPAQLISPARVERSPYTSGGKITHRGLGVRKVLTDYLNIDILRGKDHSSSNVSSNSVSSVCVSGEGSPSFELVKESASPSPSPSPSKQELAAAED